MSDLAERIEAARKAARGLGPADSRRVGAAYQIGKAESALRDAERALDAAERMLTEGASPLRVR